MAKQLRTVSSLWTGDARVPAIRISGQWLESLGFATGTRFEVVAEQGRMVLVVREDGPEYRAQTDRKEESPRRRSKSTPFKESHNPT